MNYTEQFSRHNGLSVAEKKAAVLVSVQTATECPGGCGGFLSIGDTWCASCRYAPNEQRVKTDPQFCWAWFGSLSHRMKCHRHVGHAGECHDHTDHDGNNIGRFMGRLCDYERHDDGYLYPKASRASLPVGELPKSDITEVDRVSAISFVRTCPGMDALTDEEIEDQFAGWLKLRAQRDSATRQLLTAQAALAQAEERIARLAELVDKACDRGEDGLREIAEARNIIEQVPDIFTRLIVRDSVTNIPHMNAAIKSWLERNNPLDAPPSTLRQCPSCADNDHTACTKGDCGCDHPMH